MRHQMRAGPLRRLAIGLLVGAGTMAGCGDDLPTKVYDCCPPSGLYYVCLSRESFGKCESTPSVSDGCTLQQNQSCPADPRR